MGRKVNELLYILQSFQGGFHFHSARVHGLVCNLKYTPSINLTVNGGKSKFESQWPIAVWHWHSLISLVQPLIYTELLKWLALNGRHGKCFIINKKIQYSFILVFRIRRIPSHPHPHSHKHTLSQTHTHTSIFMTSCGWHPYVSLVTNIFNQYTNQNVLKKYTYIYN